MVLAATISRGITTTTLLCLSFLLGTESVIHEITDWSANYGYCKAKTGEAPRKELAPVLMNVGDALVFKFAREASFEKYASSLTAHEVWKFADKAQYDACDVSSGATRVAWGSMGGNCPGDHPYACLLGGYGHTEEAKVVGEHYYGAEARLCKLGVKLRVDVFPLRETPLVMRHTPADIEVPYWTDDYGYCGGNDGLPPRPRGYLPITAYEGDTLVFKYSFKHNVYLADDEEAYESCSKDRMTLLAGTTEGGGCPNDDSFGTGAADCDIAAKEGFRYELKLVDNPKVTSLTSEGTGNWLNNYNSDFPVIGGKMYFVCQVHDHCANGQKVVVTILPRPYVYPETWSWTKASDAGSPIAAIVILSLFTTLLLVAVVYLRCKVQAVRSGASMAAGRQGSRGFSASTQKGGVAMSTSVTTTQRKQGEEFDDIAGSQA